MAEHNCSHPTCVKNGENSTMYREKLNFDPEKSFVVCGKHANFGNEEISVIVDDAASEASAEILASLTE